MSSSSDIFGAKVEVLSTLCTETSYAKLGQNLGEFCKEKDESAFAIDFTNVHIVAMRDSNSKFREVTDSMDIFVPDSTVLTWAVNFRGGRMKDRVYGPGFLTYMIENTPKHLTHYFLGGSQDCLDKLLDSIRRINPKFKIVGSRNGYFGAKEEEEVLAGVNAANADLVWIGLGTPKQQEWIHRFKNRINARALLAVGFAFDVNAGTKKDAPSWMQRAGLTWFYRLTQEPSRLWERYLIYNSMFINRFVRQVCFQGVNGRQTLFNSSRRVQLSKSESESTKVTSKIRFSADSPLGSRKEEEESLRSNVLGVGISPINLDQAAEQVMQAALEPGEGLYVTVTGVHGVMESQRNPTLKVIHNQSFLSTPDGMPMVWMGRWNGFKNITRVYGPDLMMTIAEKSLERNQKHFFFGGKEGVASEVSTRLQKRFPGLQAVGAVCPPFRELTVQEEQALISELNKTKPHFLWVGLSTPKQELFMAYFLKKYPDLCEGWSHRLVMIGVGAAFDFHSGRLAQAPRWMQNSGLEWFFRLLMEPRRLFRRYSVNNSTFIWGIFQQMTGRKTYEIFSSEI